jgi:hypothetical protein
LAQSQEIDCRKDTVIPGAINPSDMLSKQWGYQQMWTQLQALLFWQGDNTDLLKEEKSE